MKTAKPTGHIIAIFIWAAMMSANVPIMAQDAKLPAKAPLVAPIVTYADPQGAFTLRVPQAWKIEREDMEDGIWRTTWRLGTLKDAQFTIYSYDANTVLTPDMLEAVSTQSINLLSLWLQQNGTLTMEPIVKTRWLNRDVMRAAADYDSDLTGKHRGYMAAFLGRRTTFLVGISAPLDKQQDIAKIEDVLRSLNIESRVPLFDSASNPAPDKTESPLFEGMENDVDLSVLPPELRAIYQDQKSLVLMINDLAQLPLRDVPELDAAHTKSRWSEANAQFIATNPDTWERFLAARLASDWAARLAWQSFAAGDAASAANWFARRNTFRANGIAAAQSELTNRFESEMAVVENLLKQVPVNSPPSNARLTLQMHLQVLGQKANFLEQVAKQNNDRDAGLLWTQKRLLLAMQKAAYDISDARSGQAKEEDVYEIQLQIAGAMENVASALRNLARYEEALNLLQKSKDLRAALPLSYAPRQLDQTLWQIALVYDAQGEVFKATGFYVQALDDMNNTRAVREAAIEGETAPVMKQIARVEFLQSRAVVLNNIAAAMAAQNQYEAAARFFNDAIREVESLRALEYGKTAYLRLRAAALANLSALYIEQGENDKAVAAFDEASKLFREFGDTGNAAGMLLQLVNDFVEKNDWPEARRRALLARDLYIASGNVSGVIEANLNLCVIEWEKEHFDEAAKLASDALLLARQSGNAFSIGTCARLLASARLGQNRLDEAETLLQEAAQADERADYSDKGAPAKGSWGRAGTLRRQGELLEKRGDANSALDKYRAAIENIETVRENAASATAFSDRRSVYRFYERIVRLLLKMGRVNEAFDYLTRAKARQLQDSLRLQNVKSGDFALQAILDRMNGLRTKVEALQRNLAAEQSLPDKQQNAEKITALQKQLLIVNREMDGATAKLKTERNALAELGTGAAITQVAAVQKQIPGGTALVQFAPLGNDLFLLVITREGTKAVAAPAKLDKVYEHVREFRRLLDEARRRRARGENIAINNWLSDDIETKPLRENILALYELLLAPLSAELADKKTVVFVPNRLFYYLPLHALARRDGATLKFFGQEKQVAYLMAADVLNVLQDEPARGQGVLAIGDPKGAALPAAGTEAKSLGAIFPDAQILIGEQATKSAMLTPQNEKRRIWHLATHGVLNAAAPDKSYILLAPGAKAGDEALSLGEVYGLDLRQTDLVTLSACQTAIGERNPDGIEITSLATSFARAGAGSVIASLWSVADDSTRDFMAEFYKRLAAGETKAAAMQGAQNKLITDPRTNHPFYWAPFVLTGDWR